MKILNTLAHTSTITLLISGLAFASASTGENLKVTLLGTGSPEPRMDRFGPGVLVEAGKKMLLFDCGRGTAQRIQQLRIPFAEVDALFLTHLHSDHTVGIPDLWLSGWNRGRKTPLQVWGPTGTAAMMSHLAEAYAFDTYIRQIDDGLPGQGIVVAAHDISEAVVYDRDGVKVTAFLVDHGMVKPALGYRIDFGGHSAVLSGDTRYSENLIRHSQGVDLLIHEVINPDTFRTNNPTMSAERVQAVVGHHTTPEIAGTIFAKLKPKLAVYTHIVAGSAADLVPTTRRNYSGPLEVGEDLMSFEIGNTIAVHRPSAKSSQ